MDYTIQTNQIKRKSKNRIVYEYIEILKDKDQLEKELKKIKKELRKYKNENTPSSSNKHLKPDTRGQDKKKRAKRGAPKGHKGTTRKQNPVTVEVINTNKCPNCNSNDLIDKKIINRTTEEIPKPIIPEVKRTEIHIKECKCCRHTFIPSHNTTPLKGKFGINIMILVIFLKFLLRGVLRKTASFLDAGFMFSITPASVNSIIHRVADAAETEYEALKKKIKKSDIIYVDETSFSVLGKNQWVWVFKTADAMLLVIRPSRGNNVLEEILGKSYTGTIICDCWRAYNYLENATLQRCWAHLLRKSESLIESVAGYHFHDKLTIMFKEIKDFNMENHTKEERLNKYDNMTKKLKQIMTYYSQYEELNSVANYINFNLENWLTCIKLEGIEPTNNFAEQAIRETVVVRKIIGAFRSEKGKKSYETLASLIATWQLQSLDLKSELKRMLTKNLCFC